MCARRLERVHASLSLSLSPRMLAFINSSDGSRAPLFSAMILKYFDFYPLSSGLHPHDTPFNFYLFETLSVSSIPLLLSYINDVLKSPSLLLNTEINLALHKRDEEILLVFMTCTNAPIFSQQFVLTTARVACFARKRGTPPSISIENPSQFSPL